MLAKNMYSSCINKIESQLVNQKFGAMSNRFIGNCCRTIHTMQIKQWQWHLCDKGVNSNFGLSPHMSVQHPLSESKSKKSKTGLQAYYIFLHVVETMLDSRPTRTMLGSTLRCWGQATYVVWCTADLLDTWPLEYNIHVLWLVTEVVKSCHITCCVY